MGRGDHAIECILEVGIVATQTAHTKITSVGLLTGTHQDTLVGKIWVGRRGHRLLSRELLNRSRLLSIVSLEK